MRFWTQTAKDGQKMYKEEPVHELRDCFRDFIISLLLLLNFSYLYAIDSRFVFCGINTFLSMFIA